MLLQRPFLDRLQAAAILALTVAAMLWGAFHLTTASLWLDELTSIYIAHPDLPVGELFRSRMASDVHPPLYYLLLHPWMKTLTSSEFSVRLFSYLAYVGTVALLVILALTSRDWNLRWTLVGLLGCSPMMIAYGLEARMYSLLALACTVLTLVALQVRRRVAEKEGLPALNVVLLTLTATGTAFLHYWGALYAGVLFALLLLYASRQRSDLLRILASIGFTFGLFAPWLYLNLRTRPDLLTGEWLPWVPPRTTVSWYLDAALPGIATRVLAAGILFAALWRNGRRVRRDSTFIFCLAACGLTWLAATLVSLRVPIFKPYVLIVLLPATYLALSRLVGSLSRPVAMAAGLLLIGSIFLSNPLVHFPLKEQWRESAEYIRSSPGCERGAFFVFPPNRQLHNSRYYLPETRYDLVPAAPAARERAPEVLSDSCDILLWAVRLRPADVEPVLQTLGLGEVEYSKVQFRRAVVLEEKAP
jgi:uncharacterized membrane protein